MKKERRIRRFFFIKREACKTGPDGKMSVCPPAPLAMWAHHVHGVAVQEFLCWQPFEVVHELLFVEQESLQPTAEGATVPHATLVHLIQLPHLCTRKHTARLASTQTNSCLIQLKWSHFFFFGLEHFVLMQFAEVEICFWTSLKLY